MRSLILLVIARGLLPVTTLFALYLLWRGHNAPGGGFIAGLVTAAALLLQALAFGARFTRERLTPLLRPAMWLGLLVAMAAGLWGVAQGTPFLTHFHAYLPVPGRAPLYLSTALLFDLGVYLAVVGVTGTLMAVFSEPAPDAEAER